MNFFAIGTFMKYSTEGFPYDVFRYGETKQAGQKNVTYNPLRRKIFPYMELRTHYMVPLQSFFGHCKKKNWQKNVIFPPYSRPPALLHKLLRYRNFSSTQHTRVPIRKFSTLWDEKFLEGNRDAPSLHPPPPPPLPRNFSILDILWNTEGFPYEVFRQCETKVSRQRVMTTPS